MTNLEFDATYRADGITRLCGVDEAGRGPLAGPVFAAAVILNPDDPIEGLDDSKKLSPKKRDALFDAIFEHAEAFCVASASVEEIEQYNILRATFLAMSRAVEGLYPAPELVLVDGNAVPTGIALPVRTVVKGDSLSASIAAASILAKVSRDRYMMELDREYPQYFFAKHKGYGTAQHYQALREHGASPVHRLSFLKNMTDLPRR